MKKLFVLSVVALFCLVSFRVNAQLAPAIPGTIVASDDLVAISNALPAPIVLTTPYTLTVNTLATLGNAASGTVTWYKNKALLFTGAIYSFTPTNATFNGWYVRRVTNASGCFVEDSVLLDVQGTTMTTVKSLSTDTVSETDVAYFVVNATGGPVGSTKTTTWNLAGNPAIVATNDTLTFVAPTIAAGNSQIFTYVATTVTTPASITIKDTLTIVAYKIPTNVTAVIDTVQTCAGTPFSQAFVIGSTQAGYRYQLVNRTTLQFHGSAVTSTGGNVSLPFTQAGNYVIYVSSPARNKSVNANKYVKKL